MQLDLARGGFFALGSYQGEHLGRTLPSRYQSAMGPCPTLARTMAVLDRGQNVRNSIDAVRGFSSGVRTRRRSVYCAGESSPARGNILVDEISGEGVKTILVAIKKPHKPNINPRRSRACKVRATIITAFSRLQRHIAC